MDRLGAAFDPRSNGITAVRLGLALTVVVSHAYKLGGFGQDPGQLLTRDRTELGTIAVTAFFVLSGFLLAASRERTDTLGFLWNRFLRIFPGYWVCLAVTVLVIAPLGAMLGRTALDPSDAGAYLVGNAALLELRPFIRDVFANVPDPSIINGSLWTLAAEFICYLGLAAIPRRFFRPAATGLFIALVVTHLARLVGVVPGAIALDLPLAFATGTVAYLYRDRILIGLPGVLLAVGWLVVASTTGGFRGLAIPAVAYLVLWAGVRTPFRGTTDISYGVYVYAFPLAQLLAVVGAERLGLVGFTGLSIAVAVGAGWLSWRLVERRALGWRRVAGPATARGVTGVTGSLPAIIGTPVTEPLPVGDGT